MFPTPPINQNQMLPPSLVGARVKMAAKSSSLVGALVQMATRPSSHGALPVKMAARPSSLVGAQVKVAARPSSHGALPLKMAARPSSPGPLWNPSDCHSRPLTQVGLGPPFRPEAKVVTVFYLYLGFFAKKSARRKNWPPQNFEKSAGTRSDEFLRFCTFSQFILCFGFDS